MKTTPFSCALLLAACFSAVLPAQDQATALAQLARTADVVVVATVDNVQTPQPEWLRTQFARGQVLKGSVAASFALLEPAGRCCGNSLFALELGDQRLLFLRRTGATLHPLGGARGVLPAASAVVQHTAAVLGAADDAALAHLLVAAIDDDEPRIAEDAAHALLALPQLPLNAGERQKVREQLATAVQHGRTRAATLAELTARTADDAAVDALLPMYLDAARPDQARLLQRALERCPTELVTGRLPMFLDRGRSRDVRAAALLAAIDTPTATAGMRQMLRRPCHPEVQLRLCEGLLQKGEQSAALELLVPAPVLRMAQRRRDAGRNFRNLEPTR